ncbi:MAG: beta-lactamase family protein [Treponema sp.]|nr:beta-lactamase family protein [Treponema sp.]
MKKIRRSLLAVILIISAGFFISHYDSKEYTKENEQDYINKVCKITKNQAVAVGLIDGDKDIFLEYSAAHGQTVDKHSMFELGSTTKAFTGLGILKLEAEGLISDSDSVTKYLEWFKPQYKGADAEITINQLMNHSSGIPVYTISMLPEGDENKVGLEETVRKIAHIKLDNEPGKVHNYATINYDVLALIIEKVTGQKFEDYITNKVLREVGMIESFFRTKDSDQERIIPGRKAGFFGTWNYKAPTYYGNTAAGYIVSNTSDLAKWMRYVSKNIPFDSFPVTDSNIYYAGWHLYPETIFHGGNNPNFGTQVVISRDGKLGVFVLSATAGNVAVKIADGLYGMHLGYPAKIGLCISIHELEDFLFVIFTLLILYIALLIKYKHKWACLTAAVAIILGVILFPFISHISYRFMFVWMPFSFTVMMAAIIVFASWLLFKGCKMFYN